ncbi:MAG: efflux RND transporter periplasmic adaptor subunit [Gammaproteobacteria bacterium]|nr:efflux RND transporter periplasmic adaptor subunit [Gammaproteobacteria bacterium]
MLILAAIVFGGAVAWYFVKQQMIAKFLAAEKYPAAAVNVATVTTKDWQDYYESVGSVVAPQSVNISSEAAGLVTSIYFNSGDVVKQGQLLVALDSRAIQTQLVSDQASSTLANLTYARDKRLYKQGAIAQQDLDNAYATLQQDEAAVAHDKVLLDQMQIKAPFAGRIGLRAVSLGEYVTPGSTSIATMEQVDPLYVDFSLPQQSLSDLKVGQTVQVTVDTYGDKVFTGSISALDVGVDQDSRMMTARATLSNKDGLLYSGMFANVKILLPVHKAVVTVPQTAVTYNLYGDLVYVIKDGQAIETFVTVGERQGDDIAIEKGLKAGDVVAVSGQLKLFNCSPVIVTPDSAGK